MDSRAGYVRPSHWRKQWRHPPVGTLPPIIDKPYKIVSVIFIWEPFACMQTALFLPIICIFLGSSLVRCPLFIAYCPNLFFKRLRAPLWHYICTSVKKTPLL